MVFPNFLQFQSEFGNKEFMISATVSSQSYFCWLYRASPSLAAKNIISLISVLTIWWCPCVESSLVLLEEGVCLASACSWQNSISHCPASFCTPKPNLPVIPGVFKFLLLHSSPLLWNRYAFWVLILKGPIGLHRRVFNFSLFSVTGQGIDLDYCDIEWFALEMKRDHSVIFEIANFRLFCWLWWLLHFFSGIPAHSSRYNDHLS